MIELAKKFTQQNGHHQRTLRILWDCWYFSWTCLNSKQSIR